MFSITNVRRRLLFAALPIAALALFLTKHFSAPEPSAVRKIEQSAKAKAPRISADQGLPATTPPVDLPVASATAPVPGPTPKPVQPAREEISSALVAFKKWAEVYAVAAADKKPELVAKGLPLADARGQAMATLIKQDPQAAIEALLPYSLRKALPSEIAARIEHRVSGIGDLEVFGVTPSAGQVVTEPIYRKAKLANNKYRAYVYGSRKNDISRTKAPILGVGIKPANSEALLAVREDAYEVLDLKEAADLDPNRKQTDCPVSKEPTANRESEIAVDVVDKILWLCSSAHFPKWLKTPDGKLVAAAAGRNDGMGGAPQGRNDNWTVGSKKFLMIRVCFADQKVEDVVSEIKLSTELRKVAETLPKWSYGKMSATFSITPLIKLQYSKQYYAEKEKVDEFMMLAEARTKAAQITDSSGGHPYDTNSFQFDGAIYNETWGDYLGLGRVGDKGIYVKEANAGLMLHEWGHNFGLYHSNGWRPTTESPIGDGIAEGYANYFSTMGASSLIGSFTTQERFDLKWLPPESSTTVMSSGDYDIYNPDIDTLTVGRCHALKLRKFEMDYHIEYRPKWGKSSNPPATSFGTDNGAMFLLQNDQLLLDMTPSTKGGFYDPALLIGHSFHDPNYGVTVTPLGSFGVSPNDYLRVRVNFDDSLPNNPPVVQELEANNLYPKVGEIVVLKATAADKEDKDLAYAWDFGDNVYVEDKTKSQLAIVSENNRANMSADNKATQSKRWSTPGVYNVRCTVSDMKGKICVKSLLIRVGIPSTFTISGRITQADGFPAQGVLVNQGTIPHLAKEPYAKYSACTDANGFYSIGPLLSDTYTFYAVRDGWNFTASISNSVVVNNNVPNFDFKATKLPEKHGLTLEQWSNISGNKLENLTSSFSKPPDISRVLNRLFEVQSNSGDNYGQRMTGYFIPPVTGDYTFYISSHGHSALYLSTNNSAVKKERIALAESSKDYVNFYPHSWYSDPKQQSRPIKLTAGESYYIEALHKAGTGNDHFSVGAEFPNNSEQFPIHAAYLRPMSSPVILPPKYPPNTVRSLPEGYELCAKEYESVTFDVETDVAYGVDDSFYIKEKQKGTIWFNNGTFGDPNDRTTKFGYCRKNVVTPSEILVNKLPEDYVLCTTENGVVTFFSPTDVAYGIGTAFIIKEKQEGIVKFDNKTFGDPVGMVFKNGYCKRSSRISVNDLPEGYVQCGVENESKFFSDETDLAYGIDNKFIIKLKQKGVIKFDNQFFGDPVGGAIKVAYFKLKSIPVGPLGYRFATVEDLSYKLPGVCDVAFGKDGQFKILKNQQGTFTYNKAAFNNFDPFQGYQKYGFYKLAGAGLAIQSQAFSLDGGVNGDSDMDGIPNGIEYALQTNLDGADGSVATILGNVISFTKREIPVSNYKVIYTIEISNDLGVNDPWKELASIQDNSKIEAVMPSGAEKVFCHLRVDLVPITPE